MSSQYSQQAQYGNPTMGVSGLGQQRYSTPPIMSNPQQSSGPHSVGPPVASPLSIQSPMMVSSSIQSPIMVSSNSFQHHSPMQQQQQQHHYNNIHSPMTPSYQPQYNNIQSPMPTIQQPPPPSTSHMNSPMPQSVHLNSPMPSGQVHMNSPMTQAHINSPMPTSVSSSIHSPMMQQQQQQQTQPQPPIINSMPSYIHSPHHNQQINSPMSTSMPNQSSSQINSPYSSYQQQQMTQQHPSSSYSNQSYIDDQLYIKHQQQQQQQQQYYFMQQQHQQQQLQREQEQREREMREQKEREEQRKRFQVELEFIQCLANPNYLHFLAKQGLFDNVAFKNYLKYLLYWKRPEYVKFIKYPECLFFLDLVQREEIHESIKSLSCIKFMSQQQLLHWKYYLKNREAKEEPIEETMESVEKKTEPLIPTEITTTNNNNTNTSVKELNNDLDMLKKSKKTDTEIICLTDNLNEDKKNVKKPRNSIELSIPHTQLQQQQTHPIPIKPRPNPSPQMPAVNRTPIMPSSSPIKRPMTTPNNQRNPKNSIQRSISQQSVNK